MVYQKPDFGLSGRFGIHAYVVFTNYFSSTTDAIVVDCQPIDFDVYDRSPQWHNRTKFIKHKVRGNVHRLVVALLQINKKTTNYKENSVTEKKRKKNLNIKKLNTNKMKYEKWWWMWRLLGFSRDWPLLCVAFLLFRFVWKLSRREYVHQFFFLLFNSLPVST